MADIDLDLFKLNGENVVKGDQVFDDGRRVILFTFNDHLDYLRTAKAILVDGTFRITPHLWTQTFIISAEVTTGVFVPVAFALLPDKKKESYLAMFSLLKDTLDNLGYELSASYFMSDFEFAIRDSFQTIFPGIEAKGCAFHLAKAIQGKVARSGFKKDYENDPKFNSFTRAMIGLTYVPLDRLADGIKNPWNMFHVSDTEFGFKVQIK